MTMNKAVITAIGLGALVVGYVGYTFFKMKKEEQEDAANESVIVEANDTDEEIVSIIVPPVVIDIEKCETETTVVDINKIAEEINKSANGEIVAPNGMRLKCTSKKKDKK